MTKTTLWKSRLCLFALLLPASLWAATSDTLPRNIILIGWDGAQRNHVKECLSRNELPNLKKLADEGTIVDIDIIRQTDTKAGWTQILTGYEPEITGVYSNGRYQPIPKGYSVFERLKAFFGPDKFAAVAVIGKKGHMDADGPQKVRVQGAVAPARIKPGKAAARKKIVLAEAVPVFGENGDQTSAPAKRPRAKQAAQPAKIGGQIIMENGVNYRIEPGKPYYYTKDGMDLFLNGLMTNDNVGSKSLELIAQYKGKPFFFFIHFAEVDHAGHRAGENSKEYNDALISCDTWTGRIMDKLKELGIYDKTLVYVTADHGFDEGMHSHNDAPYVFLATNDKKVMRRGLREDITPTILDRFGADLSALDPPLSGHPLTKPYTPPKW